MKLNTDTPAKKTGNRYIRHVPCDKTKVVSG